jgi:hypothetical protein
MLIRLGCKTWRKIGLFLWHADIWIEGYEEADIMTAKTTITDAQGVSTITFVFRNESLRCGDWSHPAEIRVDASNYHQARRVLNAHTGNMKGYKLHERIA